MYLGGLVTVFVLLPNLLAVRFPPADVPPERSDKSLVDRVMEGVERVGQAGAFLLPFFYPIDLSRSYSQGALVVMVLALALYYTGWLRYVLLGHCFALFYRPMFGIPLPLAIAPVIYFSAAAMMLHARPLALATVVLAVGHFYVSWQESRRT